MLRYLGEEEAADKLERAVARVIAQGKYVTYDLKEDPADPTAVGTREMADAIIKEIEG
jgi:isocitrate dehydrogenase (NAD+)